MMMSNVEFGLSLEQNPDLRLVQIQDEIGIFRMFLARKRNINIVEKNIQSVEEYCNETI